MPTFSYASSQGIGFQEGFESDAISPSPLRARESHTESHRHAASRMMAVSSLAVKETRHRITVPSLSNQPAIVNALATSLGPLRRSAFVRRMYTRAPPAVNNRNRCLDDPRLEGSRRFWTGGEGQSGRVQQVWAGTKRGSKCTINPPNRVENPENRIENPRQNAPKIPPPKARIAFFGAI